MRKSKLIILAWLLLLVPTLLLGVGALRLLQSEEARLQSSQQAAATDRVTAIAGNIDLAIAEVKDGLQATLQQMPQQQLASQLHRWKRENPLVRNVFIWQQGRGLLLPDPERPASDEEAAFIRRFLPLFADQSSWQAPEPDQQKLPAENNVLAERRELRLLAQRAPAPAKVAESYSSDIASSAPMMAETEIAEEPAQKQGETHWRSWYADDQLHLLGWFTPVNEQQRYGVEVEMMALLSRLLGNLPAQSSSESYALLNGNGKIFHQVGKREVSANDRPIAAVSMQNLPHWQVAAYSGKAAGGTGASIMLIGSLLIGTFIIAILLGGSLLLWQAWRNQRDASRKTSFVSNVSHELKTPLTTIRMYAELLGEGKIHEAEKQRRYLQTIIKESQRLTRLVNNVLDFSRLEQGRRNYQQEPLELKQLLQDLLESQQPRLRDADIRLDLQLPETACAVKSDRDALEQIILNLLDNAVKYAAVGEKIQLQLSCSDQQLTLRLRDWGPGIPSAHKQRIFDKFHRVDNSLTTRQQGSGLGLSIARQLAQGLGGELNYLPMQDGSCFELLLPREGAK
ncbi:Histidine kinase-, DNA gyrase B-, and HSP90-like ATPase [Malonomonas rubra DSM 5091]|uniref:histidine kinase n=1 Tax=Malonomonas rubra DSM 5091 TaxID=1122189 RepID=A0A1M6EX18_MALRU|nr:HAMP domain-containing sensor histidine kinase [Malonomonas rubra]SHI89988.1 Histidine kinase-, DNA gyrase B-, and HSP90-like ATPase [Malonomonas rubra DSM 5091]